MSSRVLLIDDDGDGVLSLIRALKSLGQRAELHAASARAEGLKLFKAERPEAVVLDLCLVQAEGVESGLSLLRELVDLDPTCRVLVLTGHTSIDHGVLAMEQGAANFLAKPVNPAHLNVLLDDAVVQSGIRRAWTELRMSSEVEPLSRLAGLSPAITKVREAIKFAASTSQPVLITGETGTGKGVCARLIHDLSARRSAPFVRCQPSFAGGDFTHSELFGHVRGAFTGADRDRVGLVSEAGAGTLFLDEIDEMPRETQVTLLGVLQDKVYRPLGAGKEETAKFRLVSATNADLAKKIADGRFREDLLHRVAHFNIHLPPLRERRSDIPSIAERIIDRLRQSERVSVMRLGPAALGELTYADWPGNVRELEARVESAAYRAHFAGRREIEVDDLEPPRKSECRSGKFPELVEQYKIKLIEDALSKHVGNQSRAAAELGLDRSSLRRILSRSRAHDPHPSRPGRTLSHFR